MSDAIGGFGVLDDPVPRDRADVDDGVTITSAYADRIGRYGVPDEWTAPMVAAQCKKHMVC